MDYSAIAKKYGGTESNVPSQSIDYESIAQKYGGTTSNQPIVPASDPVNQLPPNAEIVRDLTAGGIRGAASIGATIAAPFQAAISGTGQSGAQKNREQILSTIESFLKSRGADLGSGSYQVGKIASEIAGTAGIGPTVPAASMGGRMLQGAVSGASGTALVDPESTMLGAQIGSVIPLASPIISKGTRLAGNLYDAITGQLSKVRAGKLMRDVAGSDIEAIRRAWESSPDNLTAAQAAAGVNRYEMQSLGEVARRGDPSAYGKKLTEQASLADQEMAQMAKGSSAEDSALYRDLFSKMSAAELVPIRDSILNKLRQTGQTIEDLLPRLSTVERQYVMALQSQGQLATSAGQAISPVTPRGGLSPNPEIIEGTSAEANRLRELQAINRQGASVPSVVRMPGYQTKPIDESGFQKFSNAASQAGDVVSGLRAESELLRKQISELPSTFTAAPVRDAVEAMAQGINGTKRTVASRIAEELRIAGDDPVKIAEVRSLGVNQLVNDLIQGGKLSQSDAAAALTDVKKLIDRQLGEDFVSRYMEPYAKKLQYRASLELADNLRQLQKNNPKQFLEVVRGENPDLVAKYGDWKTISEALGERRFGTVSKLASNIERDQLMAKQASEGAENLRNIINNDKFGFRIPAMLSHKATLTNAALDAVESNLNRKTKTLITEAMKSGKSANELMAAIPTYERNAAMLWITRGGPERYLQMTSAGIASNQ